MVDCWLWSIDAAPASFSVLSFAILFLSRSLLFYSSYFSVSQYLGSSFVNCILSLSLFLTLSMFLFRHVLQYFALLGLYDGFIFMRFQSLKIKVGMYYGQLCKSNVNIRFMKALHCNWKSKFWSMASVCKHVHLAFRKKTFWPRFLLVRKSAGRSLMYQFNLRGNITMVNNDIKYAVVFTIC